MRLVDNRTAAPIALVGAAAHLLIAFRNPGSAMAVVMIAMAAVCVPCAVHLWLGAAGWRTWLTTAVLSGGMVAAHLGLVAGHAGMRMPGDTPLMAVATVAAALTTLIAGVRLRPSTVARH